MEASERIKPIENSIPLRRIASVSFWENTIHVDLAATERGPMVRLSCGIDGLLIHLGAGSARVLAGVLNTAATAVERASK